MSPSPDVFSLIQVSPWAPMGSQVSPHLLTFLHLSAVPHLCHQVNVTGSTQKYVDLHWFTLFALARNSQNYSSSNSASFSPPHFKSGSIKDVNLGKYLPGL